MTTKQSSIFLASEGSYDTISTDSLGEMRSLVQAYAEDPNGAVLDGWEPREGTIITEVRAISARINQNFDAWPSEELREAHHTFVGKPVFVNHNNHDPDRARGRVVASRYVDAGEDDRYVQVLQEVEASRFPLLAKELMEGGLDSVSMGAEAREVECSYCGNISTSPFDACQHIPMKGSTLQRRTANGTPEDILIYEICRKISFFELSYVFDPADETAVASNVLVAGRQAFNDIEAPTKVDTLHPDEDEKSSDDWQEYVDDPNVIDTIDVLDEPDLGLNQELERPDDELPEGFEEFEDIDEQIEENEQAEQELAQDSREKSQEKADEEAAAAQEQFEQQQVPADGEVDPETPVGAAEADPDPEDEKNWDEEDEATGSTHRFKGGSLEIMVANDFGSVNMWVEKNGSLIASDTYLTVADAKEAAIAVAKEHRAKTNKESKMSRTARRKVAQFQKGDAAAEGFNGSEVWVYWPMFASGRGLVLDEDAEGHTFMWMIEDASGSFVKTEFADSLQEAKQAVDDYYHNLGSRKRSTMKKQADINSDDQAFKDYLGELMNPPSTPDELDVVFYDDFLVTERPDLDQHSVDYIGDMIVDSPEDYYISHTPTYSSRRNGKPRVSRTKNRDTSRRSNHMAPQRRRRIGDNNKQTPLLEETGIAQTPAPEPVALPEEGDSVSNSSESDRVKSARRALARELSREAALRRRAAQRRRAQAVGEHPAEDDADREDLFEDYPATNMTAKVRKRFANWVQANYGCSIREASGPGELRSWARSFSRQADIELSVLHSAIKRDVQALRTAADDDKDEVPDFIKEKVESDEDNPSEDDVEKAEDDKKESRRRAVARARRRKQAGEVPDSFKQNWDKDDSDDSDDSDDEKKEARRRAALRRRAAQKARNSRGRRTQTSRRRTADEKLDLAAPGDRVNVEKPTSGTTDADAEASQFDRDDFDNNSGKGLENPDTTGTPGTPGGPSVNDLTRSSARASGLQAVKLAEAMIAAGLIEDSSESKYKAAAEYEKMSRGQVLDRTALLEKVVTAQAKRRPSATKSAGNRGTSLNSAVPPNMTGMTRSSAPQRREADNSGTDSDLFF